MFCARCGKVVPDGTRSCPECGALFDENGETILDVGQREESPAFDNQKKSDFLAALLSFCVPGLGHIYIGRTARGLWILVGSVILATLALFLNILIGLGCFVAWVYGMYDSSKLAKYYNRYMAEHGGQPPW